MAQNVDYAIKGDKLIITVDLSKKTIENAPPSKSGKTCLVASTGGFTKIGDAQGKSLSLSLMVSSK